MLGRRLIQLMFLHYSRLCFPLCLHTHTLRLTSPPSWAWNPAPCAAPVSFPALHLPVPPTYTMSRGLDTWWQTRQRTCRPSMETAVSRCSRVSLQYTALPSQSTASPASRESMMQQKYFKILSKRVLELQYEKKTPIQPSECLLKFDLLLSGDQELNRLLLV